MSNVLRRVLARTIDDLCGMTTDEIINALRGATVAGVNGFTRSFARSPRYPTRRALIYQLYGLGYVRHDGVWTR